MKLFFIVIVSIIPFCVFCQNQKTQDDILIYQTLIKNIQYKHEQYFVIQKETFSNELTQIKGADIFRDTLYMYKVESKQKRGDTFFMQLQIDTSWKKDILKLSELDSIEINLPEIKKYNCIYISEDSLNSIFDPDKKGGWSLFHKTFPKSKNLLSFSRIVYSDDGDKAIVYLSQSQGNLSGSGYIYFLINMNRTWKIVYKKRMWIS
jgi:hypothetical protein